MLYWQIQLDDQKEVLLVQYLTHGAVKTDDRPPHKYAREHQLELPVAIAGEDKNLAQKTLRTSTTAAATSPP